MHLAGGSQDPGRVPGRPGADGPAAGAASLVGLKIAKDRGWTAPEPTPREENPVIPLTPVLTAHWDDPKIFTLAGYQRTGGYQGLRNALRARSLRRSCR